MLQIIKSMLTDVDGQASSKRFVMIWLAIIIWSFVHLMVFMLIKPYPTDTANTLILYDVVLIGGFGGLTLSEKIWGRPKDDSTPPKP